ncbi:MAG: Mut7-C RNAse domain-containing protein [Desulfobacteraceae bacterium]
MESRRKKASLPSIRTDATLGRLCKWLRMMGIDAEWDTATPDPERLKLLTDIDQRWVLTRSRRVFEKLGPNRSLLLRPNSPLDQMRQVIRHFKIERNDLQPLSRCSRCNHPMSETAKPNIIGRIPDYVWQRHDRFMSCSRCRRIYWPGSHVQRIQLMMDQWFR